MGKDEDDEEEKKKKKYEIDNDAKNQLLWKFHRFVMQHAYT